MAYGGAQVGQSTVMSEVNQHFDANDRFFQGIQLAPGNSLNNLKPVELATVVNKVTQ